MDTSDPLIVFDRDGYCNHCNEFINVRLPQRLANRDGESRLDALLGEIRRAGRGADYDCIVGVSGGADSSYVAYLLQKAGLRILAVHMDNGWDSEESVSNIQNLVARLKVDYQSYVLPWDEFRSLQVAFLRASVPEAETPTDVAIPAALHHFAAKFGVRHIISAGSLTTEGILPRSWHYDAKDLKYFKYICSTFGDRRLREFSTFGFKKEIFYKLVRGIRVVYPMNLIHIPKDGIISLLKEKFSYKPCGEKHYESRYTKFIQSYYLYEKFGIDYRRAKLSSEICSGLVSREAARETLRSKPYDERNIVGEKQYVAKKLNLTSEELDQIVALPPKWYWDYPNDEGKLRVIYNTYRRMFGKEKLSSF
jgi:N-acetyl sugar amidotransferase